MGALAVSGARRTRYTSHNLVHKYCLRMRGRLKSPVLRERTEEGLKAGTREREARDVQRWDLLYPAAWASVSLSKHSSGLVRP